MSTLVSPDHPIHLEKQAPAMLNQVKQIVATDLAPVAMEIDHHDKPRRSGRGQTVTKVGSIRSILFLNIALEYFNRSPACAAREVARAPERVF